MLIVNILIMNTYGVKMLIVNMYVMNMLSMNMYVVSWLWILNMYVVTCAILILQINIYHVCIETFEK